MAKPPPPPPNSERRRAERVEIMAQLELRGAGGDVMVLPLGNISARGAFVKLEMGMSMRVRAGDRVDVFLDFGRIGGEELTLRAEAEVIRVNLLAGPGRERGIGLMWKSDDPAFTAGLARVLERQQGA